MADEFYIVRIENEGSEPEFVICQSVVRISQVSGTPSGRSAFNYLNNSFTRNDRQSSSGFDFKMFEIAFIGNIRPKKLEELGVASDQALMSPDWPGWVSSE